MQYTTHLNVLRFYPVENRTDFYTEFLFKIGVDGVIFSSSKSFEENMDGQRKEREYVGLNATQLLEASAIASDYMHHLQNLETLSKSFVNIFSSQGEEIKQDKQDNTKPSVKYVNKVDPAKVDLDPFLLKVKAVKKAKELTEMYEVPWQISYDNEVLWCELFDNQLNIEYDIERDSFCLEGTAEEPAKTLTPDGVRNRIRSYKDYCKAYPDAQKKAGAGRRFVKPAPGAGKESAKE